MAERVLLVANEQAGSFDESFRGLCSRIAPQAVCGTLDDLPKAEWDLVLACGGDGTVRSVLNALLKAESQARLGIVPLGTANILAHVFGVPTDPEEALRAAFDGTERVVDVGVCKGEAFLLGCGLGLAERFVTAVGHDEKRRLGPLAYVRRLLKERGSPVVEFCVEGPWGTRSLRGVGLVVANVAQLGPKLKPLGEGEAEPDDGQLSLILLKHSGLPTMLRLAILGLFGKADADPALEVLPVPRCTISSEPKVPIQIDGDEVEQSAPFDFELLPRRLRLRVPKGAA